MPQPRTIAYSNERFLWCFSKSGLIFVGHIAIVTCLYQPTPYFQEMSVSMLRYFATTSQWLLEHDGDVSNNNTTTDYSHLTHVVDCYNIEMHSNIVSSQHSFLLFALLDKNIMVTSVTFFSNRQRTCSRNKTHEPSCHIHGATQLWHTTQTPYCRRIICASNTIVAKQQHNISQDRDARYFSKSCRHISH
jgi:hypothetical protein